jgi:hypothetical protein
MKKLPKHLKKVVSEVERFYFETRGVKMSKTFKDFVQLQIVSSYLLGLTDALNAMPIETMDMCCLKNLKKGKDIIEKLSPL